MFIGQREIGVNCEPYIIAEIGVNHDGSIERALMLTDLAAEAGADAVKLQYFKTGLLMSKTARLAAYQTAAGETDPLEMLRRLELGLSDLASIVDRAHARGLHAIVTVFNVDLVEEARGLAWDAFKTASPDIVHQPLLEAIANDDRPMIVSTGASTMGEVSRAAQWLAAARDRLAMLQCVSCYPAPEAALGGIAAIRQTTGLPTGYSDHTESVETGALAVHAGACILERHITDDRSRVGPDHAASLDGEQFAKYVALCSSALQADASGNMTHQAEHRLEAAPTATKMVLPCERDVRQVSRQSIVARRRIEQGEVIEPEDLTFKRPGNGLEPWQMPVVVGKTARHVIAEDSLIEFKDLVGLARAS